MKFDYFDVQTLAILLYSYIYNIYFKYMELIFQLE